VQDMFRTLAVRCADAVGSAWAFACAAALIFVWAVSGPAFGFSDTWQLLVNTGTTIITFLMVFLIQNVQQRESRQIQLKLDELLRIQSETKNVIDVDSLTDDELIAMTHKRTLKKASGPGAISSDSMDQADFQVCNVR
jgi:low affinity Fe/Cu permease